MPRLSKPEYVVRDERAAGALSGYFTSRGVLPSRVTSEMAKVIGCTRTTALKRLKDPESLTCREIRRLRGITDEEIIKIVRGR